MVGASGICLFCSLCILESDGRRGVSPDTGVLRGIGGFPSFEDLREDCEWLLDGSGRGLVIVAMCGVTASKVGVRRESRGFRGELEYPLRSWMDGWAVGSIDQQWCSCRAGQTARCVRGAVRLLRPIGM